MIVVFYKNCMIQYFGISVIERFMGKKVPRHKKVHEQEAFPELKLLL